MKVSQKPRRIDAFDTSLMRSLICVICKRKQLRMHKNAFLFSLKQQLAYIYRTLLFLEVVDDEVHVKLLAGADAHTISTMTG